MRQIGGHSLDGTISKVKNVEVVSEDGMIGVLLLSGQTLSRSNFMRKTPRLWLMSSLQP